MSDFKAKNIRFDFRGALTLLGELTALPQIPIGVGLCKGPTFKGTKEEGDGKEGKGEEKGDVGWLG